MPYYKTVLDRIAPASAEFRKRATRHILDFTMPPWALGKLLDLAVDLSGMQRSLELPVKRKNIVLMAGDHGVTAENVTPQPQSVTLQMVKNFASGGGGIRVLSRSVGARVTVADLGVNADLSGLVRSGKVIDLKVGRGTRDFALGPAMTREEAILALENGMRLAEKLAPETDVFGTGEMGIGNTTPSSAILCVFAEADDPLPFVGRGANLPEELLRHKADVIRRGIDLNRPSPGDGIDVLSKVGGFEIGGIAGLILGAAACRIPVVVDGFISTAGALIASSLSPASRDYMILSHGSAERGHVKMAELLGKKPLLDLGFRLGEGTGAAMAMPLLDAASALMNEMTTFGSAGVTREGL